MVAGLGSGIGEASTRLPNERAKVELTGFMLTKCRQRRYGICLRQHSAN
jgi:hypothetical protein